ncbi:MAG: hypothetical protein D6733_01510 [Methanobacteriota archaeon]|nr:MAG: hypothetical protein D6733_01510 [Euryarchaeota archaeon]
MVELEPIEVFQIVGWLVAIVFSYQFRELAKGATSAWTWIFFGTLLFFLRVTWKFVPGYDASLQLQAIRYILGALAAFVMTKGFLDYYVTTKAMVV